MRLILRLERSLSPASRKMLDFSWDFLDMSMARFRSSIHFPISTLELWTKRGANKILITHVGKKLSICTIQEAEFKKFFFFFSVILPSSLHDIICGASIKGSFGLLTLVHFGDIIYYCIFQIILLLFGGKNQKCVHSWNVTCITHMVCAELHKVKKVISEPG